MFSPCNHSKLPSRFSCAVLTLLATATALSSPAYAAAYCDSYVDQFFTTQAGDVLVLPAFRNDWVQICNVQSAWNGVSPATCTSWLSTLISGMISRKQFTFYYASASVCSTIPTYGSAPAPGYVLLRTAP